jgi:hypothetical protein
MKRYSPYLDEEIEFKRMVQFVLDHFLLYDLTFTLNL